MFQYKLGVWELIFDKKYRTIEGKNEVVVLDEEREILVLLSLKEEGVLCVERPCYNMTYSINAKEQKVIFNTMEEEE